MEDSKSRYPFFKNIIKIIVSARNNSYNIHSSF